MMCQKKTSGNVLIVTHNQAQLFEKTNGCIALAPSEGVVLSAIAAARHTQRGRSAAFPERLRAALCEGAYERSSVGAADANTKADRTFEAILTVPVKHLGCVIVQHIAFCHFVDSCQLNRASLQVHCGKGRCATRSSFPFVRYL